MNPNAQIDGGGFFIDFIDTTPSLNWFGITGIVWQGLGVVPTLTLSPTGPVSQLGFGAVEQQVVTLGNSGANDLIITSIAVADGGSGAYSLDAGSPTALTLTAGATTDVLVLFDSSVLGAGGNGTADLNVTSNNGGTPGTVDTVAFSGTRASIFEWGAASGTGDWDIDGASWIPAGPPSQVDQALISGGNLSKNGSNVVVDEVDGLALVGRLEVTGGVLNANDIAIRALAVARTGRGLMTMSDGTLNLSAFIVGNIGNAEGVLNLSGGTINILEPATFGGAPFHVGSGQNSDGVVNMTGGTINGASDIMIGRQGGNTGQFNISSGSIVTTDTIFVGNQGQGELNISGDASVTANALLSPSATGLFLGINSTTAMGTLNMSSGELIVNGNITARAPNHEINWTGGLIAVNGDINLNTIQTSPTVNFVHPADAVLSPGHTVQGSIAFTGDSPTSTTNYVQQTSAVLLLQVFGGAFTEADSIAQAGGTATLNGIIKIETPNGEPALGSVWTIVDSQNGATIINNATLDTPASATGEWGVDFQDGDLKLYFNSPGQGLPVPAATGNWWQLID